MKLGIIRLYAGQCFEPGYYNIQEFGFAKELLKKLNSEQIFVFLLVPKSVLKEVTTEQIFKGVVLVNVPCIKIGSHGIFNKSVFDDFKLDALHVIADIQIYASSVIKYALSKKMKVTTYFGTIQTSDCNYLKKIYSSLIMNYNKRQLNRTVVNFAKTPSVRKQLEDIGIKKLELLPVGLDITSFGDESMSCRDIRRELDLPVEKKLLLFVGRLEKYKYPEFALKLLEYISLKSQEFTLVIVGKGSLKDKLIEYATRNNTLEKIFFFEDIKNKDIWKFYKASDVFINANSREIYGMSILEAMYFGCPVVAVSAPGPDYIIDNGVNGFICNDFDYEHWWSCVREAVTNKKNYAEKSRTKIIKELSWEADANKYISMI